jgi:hypothetical protein
VPVLGRKTMKIKSLDKQEMKELLVKCWMTHDGLWFYHALQECGIEKTSKINQAAARAIGTVEARRIMRALGVKSIEDFEGLMEFMEHGFSLVRGDFMEFDFDSSVENVLHIDAKRCFAFEGISKMGAIDGYDCGIFARMAGWFDEMGIHYEVTPPVRGCMMHKEGKCFRDFKFKF